MTISGGSFPQFPSYRTIRAISPEAAGMGVVLLVEHIDSRQEYALKYCDAKDLRDRFVREVSIQSSFSDPRRVMPVVDADLAHDPPYFVMPVAAGGNLLDWSPIYDEALRERVFLRMIDCVSVVAARGHVHRDIKPANFLMMSAGDDRVDSIVIADFGLSRHTEGTRHTATSLQAGTHEFAPPEFHEMGAFKNATTAWDIYTLGKSFYRIATGKHALFPLRQYVPAALWVVIEKCTETDAANRYQSFDELRAAVVTAFDTLLGRSAPEIAASSRLAKIIQQADTGHVSYPDFTAFAQELVAAGEEVRHELCKQITQPLFQIYAVSRPLHDALRGLLRAYGEMVDEAVYPFHFAEDIANRMKVVFRLPGSPPELRATALDHAIRAAIRQNRFAAMDTCASLVEQTAADDSQLGPLVARIVREHRDSFLVGRLDVSRIANIAVANAVAEIQRKPLT